MEEAIRNVQCQLYPQLTLKPEQLSSIQNIIEGNNVKVNLPVGFGKSVIFHMLPRIFEKLGRVNNKVLVVSPLNSIMEEQSEKLKKINVKAVQLSQKCQVIENNKDSCEDVFMESLNASIILTHPEGLLVAENGIKLLRALEGKVGAIVIDVCHKIDNWGREFRKSFSELVVLKSFFNNIPMACLSGTLAGKHINALSKQLLISNFKVISVSPEKTNLKLIVCEKIKGSSYEKIENI
ncbi:unnamed protein product [Mytilus coruscus]|uniref:Helicase ATP-binding domain-containing protein n=1 Tax=Mytilus coruscus TaxID=42192 RepID=A0A6J8BCN9_MYTCO|nr:unnamed protein product [Mytilus coruscus]